MNHILLPNCSAGEAGTRYGTQAMELLVAELIKLGGDRRRFVAKAFGGGNVIAGARLAAIGEGNAACVRLFLAKQKIPLVAERLGGDHAVHVYFQTDTGKATVYTVDGSILATIARSSNPAEESCLPSKP
jgi:chemotaxis protein CheD